MSDRFLETLNGMQRCTDVDLTNGVQADICNKR